MMNEIKTISNQSLWTTIILLLIAGLANGLMDTIKFHNRWPDSKLFGPDSWKNIYQDNDPSKGPKRFLSTSVLAFMYDGWHLCKMIMIESLVIAIVLSCERCETIFSYTLMYIIYRSAFFIGFEITYK